jgi:hypothetical protein
MRDALCRHANGYGLFADRSALGPKGEVRADSKRTLNGPLMTVDQKYLTYFQAALLSRSDRQHAPLFLCVRCLRNANVRAALRGARPLNAG